MVGVGLENVGLSRIKMLQGRLSFNNVLGCVSIVRYSQISFVTTRNITRKAVPSAECVGSKKVAVCSLQA